MKNRILSFVLCLVVTLNMVFASGIAATTVQASSDTQQFVDYGSAIGNTAKFDLSWGTFLVYDDPTQFSEEDWENDEYYLHCEITNEAPDVTENHLMVVTDYYWDKETTALWYQVKPAPGYTMTDKLETYPWVFQNYTEYYVEEGWEEWSPDSLIIDEGGRNYIYDGDDNFVSAVTMGAYDTFQLKCESTLLGKVDYQWQIFSDGEWVDILGEEEAKISVTIGMLFSVLDADYTALVRCVATVGSKSVVGEAIPITIEPYAFTESDSNANTTAESYALSRNIFTSVSGSNAYAAAESYALSRNISASVSDSNAIMAADASDYYYVTVKYLFQNGAEAANPFVAQIMNEGMLDVTVEFPTVQGYLPYYQNTQQNSLVLYETVTSDVTYMVYYLPTDVEYRVDVYFQNVDDDNYTYQGTETLKGLTGTQVPHLTVSYEGMYELLHETPEIAANGSTRLEVYFNRTYYLTHFNLDGGYGVYPIYARYGATFADNVGTPIKPGYTFVGWDDISEGTGDGMADVLPETVPAKEQSFKAVWKENPTAVVRIAFWGENPNDEGYSYLESQTISVKPGTVLTYGTGGYICGLEEHTHGSGCTYLCGRAEHAHGQNCYLLTCNEGHTHSDDCYNCGETGHSHRSECYEGVYGDAFSPSYREWNVSGTESNGSIGQSFFMGYGTGKKYIYIIDGWYEYTGTVGIGGTQQPTCGKTESTHSHTDACLGCGKEEHTHSDYTGSCYTLNCTIEEHAHTADCYSCLVHQHSSSCQINEFEDYKDNLWTLVKSDTVTVASDGTTVMNVYYDRTTFTMTFRDTDNNGGEVLGTIQDKWGADIRVRFQAMCNAHTFLWSRKTGGGSPWTSFLDVMPGENRTYYAYKTNSTDVQTATYIGADLNGNYTENLFTSSVKYRGNLTVSEEEFVEIEGYVFNASESSEIGDAFAGAVFKYDRKSYQLEFYSGVTLARTEYPKFEESFAEFKDYVPSFPSEYEAGSRNFAGWYLNPEFTEPADLANMKMPAKNMALYAKWELAYHTVHIYKEKFDDGTFGDPVLVDGKEPDPVLHGDTVFTSGKTIPDPENGPYSFVGWFYMDGDEERMWDFEHSVVVKDVDIYAKWSANVLVPYTIHYIVQNEDGTKTEIAETISSSALAGTTVTFHAKGGLELYEGYQTGYFPVTTSHSLTMDIYKAEEGMTYDFVYVAKEAVPYTVRYVDEAGTDLIEPKVVSDNTYAVVTEKFVYIPEYVPDKFQKTLVINGADDATNEIVFYYRKDATQGVYNVTHYIRSTDGVNYTEYSTYGDIGTIGEVLKVKPLVINGFTYSEAYVNAVKTDLVDGAVNGTVVKEGLEIKLYYERNKYPYMIRYLDEDTFKELADAVIVAEGEYFGAMVTETNPPVIENYILSSVSSCVITQDGAEPVKNIVTVYYAEQTVRINYEVVGPDNCGTISPEYTEVKVLSGTGATSTAAANEGFRFVGWYQDKECTQLITANDTLNLVIPEDKVWKPAIYYAKFIYEDGDLTISRTDAEDDDQVFVYEVKNTETGGTIYVTVTGNGATTIHGLPLGEYTVTQHNNWSWRYSDAALVVDHLNPDGTDVDFSKVVDTSQWLNGNSVLIKNQRG